MVGADAECYAKHGYALLGRVLSDEDLQQLLAEELRFRPARSHGRRANRTLRVAVQLCHRSEPVRRMATRGPHIPAVVQLVGPDVCLTHVQFVTKLSDQPGVGAGLASDDSTYSDIKRAIDAVDEELSAGSIGWQSGSKTPHTVVNLLKRMERETGFEPATSSLGS